MTSKSNTVGSALPDVRKRRCFLVALTSISIGACQQARVEPASPGAAPVAKTHVVVDAHQHLPFRLHLRQHAAEPIDVSASAPDGKFDYPRAVQGGVGVVFQSVLAETAFMPAGRSREFAEVQIGLLENLCREHPDRFRVLRASNELDSRAPGQIDFVVTLENTLALEEDVRNVAHFYARGVRSMTLVHFSENACGDSQDTPGDRWGGLSPFGREVVAEMNRLGMIVDVAHMTEAAIADTLRVTRAPILSSHSGCLALVPGEGSMLPPTNHSDRILRAIGENGGVVCILFSGHALVQGYLASTIEHAPEIVGEITRRGIDPSSAQATGLLKDRLASELPEVTVTDLCDHIDHVVSIAGIDHVGLGSDFDSGQLSPSGASDVSGYPVIAEELHRRGYSPEHASKIMGGNLLRLWHEVEQAAAAIDD